MKTWSKVFIIILLIGIFAVSGCASEQDRQSGDETTITDSIGREVKVNLPLKKVVVANGYNTELLNAIGAIDCVVGVDYGIYQDQEEYKGRFKEVQVIGKSQRELNYERIIELAPDALILTGNGSWEDAEKKLSKFGIKVIVLDSYYTDQFFSNCRLAGKLFCREKQAEELEKFFRSKLEYIEKQLKNVPKEKVYFEYRREGNTTVPGDYFYNMVKYAGAENIFEDAKSVSVNSESIILRNPDYIIKVGELNVSPKYIPPTETEWLERKRKLKERAGWDSINAVKNDRILLISHFAHGGASKLIGTMYIAKYLYPEQLPELHPEQIFKIWLTKYQHLDYIKGHTYPAFKFED